MYTKDKTAQGVETGTVYSENKKLQKIEWYTHTYVHIESKEFVSQWTRQGMGDLHGRSER